MSLNHLIKIYFDWWMLLIGWVFYAVVPCLWTSQDAFPAELRIVHQHNADHIFSLNALLLFTSNRETKNIFVLCLLSSMQQNCFWKRLFFVFVNERDSTSKKLNHLLILTSLETCMTCLFCGKQKEMFSRTSKLLFSTM